MVPIRKGDGTEVVPSGIKQVRAGDGRVFAESAIPDGVVHRWPIEEGSGSTITDSVGDADGTINGPTWLSGTWVGDNALEGDGSDDYVDLPVESFGSELGGECGIVFTFETTNKDFDNYIGVQNTADETTFQSFPSGTGQIAFLVQDSSGSQIQIRTDDNEDYSDGNKHRAVLQKTGDTIDDLEIAVDGSFVSTGNIIDDGTLGTFSNFEYPLTLFGRRDGSDTVASHIGATIDLPMLLDSAWDSGQVQDDYDNQPWS